VSYTVGLRLDLIAAKARQLSDDYQRGKLWDGDLQRGLSEIQKQLNEAMQESRVDK